MRPLFFLGLALNLFFLSFLAAAQNPPKESLPKEPLKVRWTTQKSTNSKLESILNQINNELKTQYYVRDFKLLEERDLATSHYQFWTQTLKGAAIHNRSVRIWTELNSGGLLQMEAWLEPQENTQQMLLDLASQGFSSRELQARLSSQETIALVNNLVKSMDDGQVRSITWRDLWYKQSLSRLVKVRGKRGYHWIWIDLTTATVTENYYNEFSQVDLPALVYPIWEEQENNVVPIRIPVILQNLKDQVPRVTSDPYAVMRTRRYFEEKLDPILGLDPVFQAKGYWSSAMLREDARQILSKLPLRPNDFSNGVILDGKYVTINIHPLAEKKFPGIKYKMQPSAQYKPDWRPVEIDGKEIMEMVPMNAVHGQFLTDSASALNRVAQRHPDNDPTTYINDGFDEIQVYWAVDTLMTTLHKMGFTDPELSTRPFNAILYDPDISMKDNAYYTDDTINFTTYSPKAQNYARDNTTTWHELGHGVMDRLMGDYITLADTGGLSEGMADFLAQLVIHAVLKGQDYEGIDKMRIINQTGFNLTNEVHDDGEAYGGTLNDFLVKAINQYGHTQGLAKVTDLTLEAMRLSRNHPGLSAQEWFSHMLFADQLPGSNRSPGELKDALIAALKGRNFAFGSEATASFGLKMGNDEITDKSAGSRNKPILVEVKKTEWANYDMSTKLTSSPTYQFQYPVTVRVQFEGGPIQGAIHWEGQQHKFVDYILNSEQDLANFKLKASGTCDYVNRDDGTCVDFAYIQIWNAGIKTRPVAKKRFYLRVKGI